LRRTVIIKEAFGDVEKIHNRMPVILRAEQIENWLNGNLPPEEITRLDFNANIAPCKNNFLQMKL
jgi:putative SOS response-associated peptidase YedK